MMELLHSPAQLALRASPVVEFGTTAARLPDLVGALRDHLARDISFRGGAGDRRCRTRNRAVAHFGRSRRRGRRGDGPGGGGGRCGGGGLAEWLGHRFFSL